MRGVLRGRGRLVGEVGDLDELTRLGEVDVVGWHPGALVVAVGDLTVGADAHAVRGADAGGVDFELLAVGRHLEDAAVVVAERTPAAATRVHGATFEEVEVALAVRLQVEGELVEVRGDLDVVVEVLVEIGLAVAVEVLEAGDLVATEDVELLVDDRQAEGVEDAGGVAAPADLGEVGVGDLADPHVAAPGREGDAAVLEEREGADADPGLVGVGLGDGDVVDEVGGVEDLGQFVLQGGLLVGVGGLGELLLDRVGLLGLVDLAEHAFGHDFFLPVRRAALGEGAQVGGLGDGRGGLGEGPGVLAAVGEGDLEARAGGDLAEFQREHVTFGRERAGDAVDGDRGGQLVAGLALGERERGGEAFGLHGTAVGQVREADGFGEVTGDDREGAAEDLDAIDGLEFGAFEQAGPADGVGEGDAIAGEVEAEVLGVLAGQGTQRNRRHDAGGADGEFAGFRETAVLAPTGARVGLDVEVGALGGGGVRAVRAVEGHALALEPATRPETGAAQGLGIESVAGVLLAEVHQDGLVGGAALVLERILAERVVDGGAQEATVVHVHVFAGRLGGLLGFGLLGLRLLGGVGGETGEDRQRQGAEGEQVAGGRHRGEGKGEGPGVGAFSI